MTDHVLITITGRAGRITLDRDDALNALTDAMVARIDAALIAWAGDPAVEIVIIDAAGDRAFCAGGDLRALHTAIEAGDTDRVRAFWQNEYRMNARLALYAKPVVSFMNGLAMGGGVGLGCHAGHRVVGATSQLALPEVGVGLVPDAGGSLLLARAPGSLGAFLGTTAARMEPADAIFAGFADHFIDEAAWPDLIAALAANPDPSQIAAAATKPPSGELAQLLPQIDRHFSGRTLGDIVAALRAENSEMSWAIEARMARNAPLAMAATIQMIHRLRATSDILAALELEYRYVSRSLEQGDFAEGIRAAMIDRDQTPRWRHSDLAAVPEQAVDAMLAPMDDGRWQFARPQT
ncbi:MAG: enoyl-CoA hydratase/isomerase family protein [Pseudomonadota bacterium]